MMKILVILMTFFSFTLMAETICDQYKAEGMIRHIDQKDYLVLHEGSLSQQKILFELERSEKVRALRNVLVSLDFKMKKEKGVLSIFEVSKITFATIDPLNRPNSITQGKCEK